MSNKLIQYITESKSELRKVVWPTRKQAVNSAILVIAFSLGLAIFLGMVDFGLTKVLESVV